MRINIKGNDVTPEKIAAALATCERDYNLKVTGATIYVRFENASGQQVDPLQNGEEFSRDFNFWKPRPVKMPKAPSVPQPQPRPEPVDPISAREMIELCEKEAKRVLSGVEMKYLVDIEKNLKVDRTMFRECLARTVLNTGKLSMPYLRSMVYHRCK